MKLAWHIAIDLGSSSGRIFLGRFNDHEPLIRPPKGGNFLCFRTVGRTLRVSRSPSDGSAGTPRPTNFEIPIPELIEAHRFANAPIFQAGHWRWDWTYLRSEIQAGLRKAAELAGHGKIVSLGCSSWAQDFILLGAGGQVLENPICYRDEFTRGLPQAFASVISPLELVQRVGCSVSPITTLCKLKALRDTCPQLLQRAKIMLHMADMVHFDLSGEAATDWTLATAGQLFNIRNETWDLDLLARLDIPAHILPPVIMRPRIIGRVKAAASPHPRLNNVPIVSTAHHDTSCATVCFRPLNPNISRAMSNIRPSLRLRSGQAGFDVNDLRRSCSGLTLSKPLQRSVETSAREIPIAEVLMKRVRECSFHKQVKPGLFFICLGSYAMPGCVLSSAKWPANADPEKNVLIGIADRRWGLFGNCAGLWIIQECRRIWQARGIRIEYDHLMRFVEDSNYQGMIDLTSPRFARPTDMITEIQTVCRENGLAEPKEPGDVAKLVFDSLAAGFGQTVHSLQEAGKISCSTLYLAGGGSRNKYLVRQIAARTGCKIIIGPAEATAVGNLTLQREVMENSGTSV